MRKGTLQRSLKPEEYLSSDYTGLVESMWGPLVEQGLSFVVKDVNDRMLGVALNFDAKNEPKPDPSLLIGGVLTIVQLVDYLELQIK